MIDSTIALDRAWIDPRVWDAHPDYVALLMTVDGLGRVSDGALGEAALSAAETATVTLLDGRAPEELDEIAVWRAAFASFGVKPRVARSSVEALLRRCADGLPRIEPLTDVYNAVSVEYRVPIGGEDLDCYVGPPRLVVADGTESFDTVADGQPTMQSPDAGEIVWRDDVGVTCRRWNWRQGTRTRLSPTTARALFILDGLGDGAGERVTAAADALEAHLRRGWPSVVVARRTLSRPTQI